MQYPIRNALDVSAYEHAACCQKSVFSARFTPKLIIKTCKLLKLFQQKFAIRIGLWTPMLQHIPRYP